MAMPEEKFGLISTIELKDPTTLLLVSIFLGSLGAVSYTHLDVYKRQVLDMSKIESGKLTLTAEQVSLKEVVEGIVNIMQPQVKTKKQTFDILVDNILAENVWCDGVRLNQVLLNLLSNATKYTPEGDVYKRQT